eukprot:CAMPEP_0170620320 /NCGR_PEP_ID=MMETSP0224-20130122/27996_1 /TAXON_ID=285029 /ORGANISM="Togula jolla, Strain CCCM 725" /LENGTH=160 /DNA_ID=CAMNT_0010946487 /DNA_START=60 /DNA_END=542 /DNA_ORIENTATION=-
MMVPEEESSKAALSAAPAASKPVSSRFAVDHRALLFGSRFGGPMQENRRGHAAAEASRARDLEKAAIEEQNDGLLDKLADRVTALKEVSKDVGREVRESSILVRGMKSSAEKALNDLQRTTKRLGEMAKKPACMHVLRLTAFATMLLVFLWLLYPKLHFG